MVDINPLTLIITLESGVTNIDWINVYSDWKDWLLESPYNRGCPPAFETTGGEAVNTLLDSGSYFFIRNDLGWRIKPPEEDISIYASGNMVAKDSTLPILTPTLGGYTAGIFGLQPITQGFSTALGDGLRHGLFNNGVTYDVINGYPGTGTAPNGQQIGTPRAPSSVIADSKTIADDNGLICGYINGNLTFDTVTSVIGFSFYGDSKDRTTITIPEASTVEDCAFYEAKITGTLDGDSKLYRCLVENLSYIRGYIEECVLSGVGIIQLGGGETSYFLGCYGGTAQPVTIDLGGSGQVLIMEEQYGEVLLQNKTGSDNVYIVLGGGSVRLDLTTVTNGTIHIAGDGELLDNSDDSHIVSGTYGNLTIINKALCTHAVADTVINYDLTGYDTHKTLGGIQVRSAYNDKIEVNILDGGAGSSFPVGMEHQPVNNIPDALLLLEQFHFNKLRINDDVPIPESTNLNGITFISGATIDRKITIPATCTTNGSKFKNIILDGYLNGRTDLSGCVIEEVFGFRGNMSKCTIETGLTVDDSTGQTLHIHDCAGGGGSYLDIGSAAAYVTNFTGVIEIINKDSSNLLGMHLNGAVVIIANTCTDGMIMLTGEGTVIDNSGAGCIVDSSRVVNKFNFISYLEKIINNKREVKKNGSVWEVIVYDDDDVTPILTKVLKDKDINDITDLLTGVLAQELSNSV